MSWRRLFGHSEPDLMAENRADRVIGRLESVADDLRATVAQLKQMAVEKETNGGGPDPR